MHCVYNCITKKTFFTKNQFKMGLSNSEQTKTTYVKMFSKEPGTDDVNAFFGKSEKVDGKWQTTQRFDTIEGILTSAGVGEFTYQNDTKKTLKLVFTDESGERVQIESTFTLLTYNVINALYGCNLEKPIKIKLYVKKGTDRNMAAAYIENGGERASWAYEPSQLPKPHKVTVGKKEVIDDSEVVEFYERLALEIGVRASSTPKRQPLTPQAPEQEMRGDGALKRLAEQKALAESGRQAVKETKTQNPKQDEQVPEPIGDQDDLPF